MNWSVYLAHFFGGAFLLNALPHLIAGIAGRDLQTPFAKPPFRGLSSPLVNVAWALVNFALAYLLLIRLTPLDVRNLTDFAVFFAGFGAMAFQCARAFRKLRS